MAVFVTMMFTCINCVCFVYVVVVLLFSVGHALRVTGPQGSLTGLTGW